MPPKAVEQSFITRFEVESSLFTDSITIYLTYERCVEAANRYLIVLSEAENEIKTVEEIVQLIIAGKKHYYNCMDALAERGERMTLLAFVIRAIDANPAAAQISRNMSIEMSRRNLDQPEEETTVLRQRTIEYAEAHRDRSLTMEDRSKYLQWVRLAERWENDSLLGKGSLPHHIYMLGLAEDSPEEERIRAMFKCGRKSLEQVLKMEDVRLRQMGQIVDVSSEIDGENEKVMGACKEGKEWSHYLGVLQSDISSPMFLGADEGLYRRKMLEIKIAKSKTTPLRKTLRNYNKLQKKEERLVYSWGAMLEKIRAANTSRGDALKDLFAPM